MKIGLRTVKTALGVGLSVWLAELLHLNFSASAAIIAILCLERTKKRSIQTSLNRFFACVLGLGISSVFFSLLGYHFYVFTIYILLFIPLLVRLKIQSGFVTSVVIALHIYMLKSVTKPIIINEIEIILIGIGVAILLNSYMPNLEKELKEIQEEIENRFKTILFQYGAYIEKGDQKWDGKELLELDSLLNKAKEIGLTKSENHMIVNKKDYYHYFEMREKQFEILNRMLPVVSFLIDDVPQRQIFAEFLYQLSEDVKSDNTADRHLKELETQRVKMKELELPKTRREFETRASLFHLMNEMEYYLKMKINHYNINKIEI